MLPRADNLCKLSAHGDPPRPLNPRPGPTSWLHPLAYKRFHVLLNSLFKVLCNFPSQYLFAIGLAVIFSLNRSLPAALCCTFKQHDSNVPRLARTAAHSLWAFHPLWASPVQRNLRVRHVRGKHLGTHVAPHCTPLSTTGLHAGLFPFHSPLLRESLLFSLPPLNYMLKLSG